jgi:single-strand DNA-binding protein
MSKRYDVVATIGQYEKDGQTKYVTRNVGAVIQTSKGFRLKLDASFNPAGCPRSDDGGVWLALFEPRDEQQQGQQQAPRQAQRSQQAAPPDDFDSEIPFLPLHHLAGA